MSRGNPELILTAAAGVLGRVVYEADAVDIGGVLVDDIPFSITDVTHGKSQEYLSFKRSAKVQSKIIKA